MFSLESPHRGDFIEYTQYTIFNIKRDSPLIILNLQLWDFCKRHKNEFEISVVNEPSVFEPLKFHCMGEYLTTGLFMSGCYFAVICNNKLLNFVLFHKRSFSLIILI